MQALKERLKQRQQLLGCNQNNNINVQQSEETSNWKSVFSTQLSTENRNEQPQSQLQPQLQQQHQVQPHFRQRQAQQPQSDIEMEEVSICYPPKAEYLPLSNVEARLSSRIGHTASQVGGIASRLGQRKDGIASRLGTSLMDPDVETPGVKREGTFHVENYEAAQEFPVDASYFDDDDERKKKRCQRFGEIQECFSKHRAKKSFQSVIPILMENYQEYDIEKMKHRAQTYSDVPCLKKRARRFDEETANELVQVKEAKRKNERFKRFKLGEDSSSSEEDE